MNKRGNAIAIITWIGAVLIILFFLGGYLYFFHTLTDRLSEIGPKVDSNIVNFTGAVSSVFVPIDTAMNSLRWISFIIIATLAFSILLENFYIREHPVLFIIHIFMVILGVVAAIYVSNSYESLLKQGVLASTLTGFSASNFIVLNLPIWVAVIGIFGLVLLMINANRDPYIKVGGGL